MKFSDESYDLRIELDTKACELSANEISKMEDDLSTLRHAVEGFPVANLYITVVYHARSNTYHVKTALALSGTTLFTGDRDAAVHPAYERCVRKLLRKVARYKHRMRHDTEIAKQEEGTHQSIVPLGEFDVQRLHEAVQAGDYVEFHNALDVFAGPLEDRIGRWVERYPALESTLGMDIKISDIAEEVILIAFECFLHRPRDVPAGTWLESLLDPAIRALIDSPEEELTNIGYLKSLRDTEG